MIEFFTYLAALIVLMFLFWIIWETTMILEERKQRYRKGITDYYDNPIKKDKT